jgi:glycosyltransferase involved in cell wall biosynthesis
MELGLSIIICTYNGKNRLGLVLNYINNLYIPNSLLCEVLIVDNASTDDTSTWVKNYILSRQLKFQIVLIKENNPGLNTARLTGAKHSRYDWLLFCDDDNLLSYDYIKVWFEVISTHKNLGAVGGRGIAVIKDTIPEWFNKYSHSYAVGPQLDKTGFVGLGSALYGAGLFVFKIPILNIVNVGFTMVMSDRESGKLTSGGDLEWCYLLQLAGLILYYDERLIFKHQIALTRLNWNYYFKLKSGIASGVGLLESYHFIFKRGYRSNFIFMLHYLHQLAYSILIYYFNWIKLTIFNFNSMDNENRLSLRILKSKSFSYFSQFQSSCIHYKSLNNTFNATI